MLCFEKIWDVGQCDDTQKSEFQAVEQAKTQASSHILRITHFIVFPNKEPY